MLSTKQITIGSLLLLTFSISVYYATKKNTQKIEKDDEEKKSE